MLNLKKSIFIFNASTRFSGGILKRAFSLTLNNRAVTEVEILDLFNPKGPPTYDKVFTPDIVKPEVQQEKKTEKKKGSVVINCKRPEFNHYKNQKYDKLKPIQLASKGWHHRKSKGDFFTIKIYDQQDDVDSLYWGEESFSDLKLSTNLIDALGSMNIQKPTQIQIKSIPQVLSGRNCLITAETGCGKTLAYLLPIIEQLLVWSKIRTERPPNSPLAIVISPHRELAIQIGDVAKNLSHCLPFNCTTLIGGRTKRKMLNPHFDYIDLLVATPGSLSKLITTGIYNVNEVRHLVLDEADTMLDDTFSELVLRLLRKFKINFQNRPLSAKNYPDGCQITLVSATMPKSIYKILEDVVETDSLVSIKSHRLHRILPHVPQTFFRLNASEKPTKLLHLVKNSVRSRQPTLIFSNKSSTCDWISMMLNENGVPALNLNGEMNYAIRLGKYKEFQNGNVLTLSCTDVASRGLDTIHVKHILNYDFPVHMADYIHRSGRAGRCGSPSDTFISNFISRNKEVDLLNKIEMAVRMQGDLPNVDGNVAKFFNR